MHVELAILVCSGLFLLRVENMPTTPLMKQHIMTLIAAASGRVSPWDSGSKSRSSSCTGGIDADWTCRDRIATIASRAVGEGLASL